MHLTHRLTDSVPTEVSPDTYVSIMAQYYPAGRVSQEKYPELCRRTTSREVQEAIAIAREAGLHRFDERWRQA